MTGTGVRMHLCYAGAALLFAAAHLTFEHFNGGVVSHHLLNRADLPAISNWLGLLVLPVLAFLLAFRVRRLAGPIAGTTSKRQVIAGLVGAALYGAALAAGFESGQETLTSGLFFALFALAAVVPIYRIECVLGFVVGMTFTFGAVLPTLIASVFALLSILLNPLLRFLTRTLVRATRGADSAAAGIPPGS